MDLGIFGTKVVLPNSHRILEDRVSRFSFHEAALGFIGTSFASGNLKSFKALNGKHDTFSEDVGI